MIKQRGEELKPGYKKTTFTAIKGKRTCNNTSLIKTEASPGDTYYVPMPSLAPNQCIIPDTLRLSFKFVNSNTKSWFLNNLGRLLCEKLAVTVGGELVYDNTGESILEVYKDLWLSEDKRKSMVEYGIADENVRKMISKDDSNVQTRKTDGVYDLVLKKHFSEQKIKLGKILKDHGPYSPYDMKGAFEYRITLPGAEKIMKAQAGESVAGNKLKDIHLEYETIESAELAKQVNEGYEVGRSLNYDYTTLLKSLPWGKDSLREVIDINIPRKSMKAVVLLFTRSDAGNSEEYYFPDVTKVNVTVEGNPNAVYSQGLTSSGMYDEAKRFFGTKDDTCNDNISAKNFFANKFAIVIDLRTVDDDTVVGSGRRLVGTQSGILLEIEKETVANDCLCHVFVVADGLINIVEKSLQGIEY